KSREIYYRCLALGFTGRYPDNDRRLNQIRHDQARQLSLVLEDVQSIDKLTPQPYQAVTSVPPKPPWPERLRPVTRALLVAVPVALWLAILLWPAPQEPPVTEQPSRDSEMPNPPRPQPLSPSPALRERIEAVLRPYQNQQPCYTITTSVDEQRGAV